MLKKNNIIIFAFAFLLLASCKKGNFDLFKNRKNSLPEVKTVSAEMLNDDVVKITGEVTYAGKSAMEYTGFCISTNPTPKMLDNQILLNGTVGKYSAEITNLEPNQVYYFRAFAANVYGYVYGNIIRFEVPNPQPPTVPCTLANNVLIRNGYSYNLIDKDTTQTTITASTSSGLSIELSFPKKPVNGIYTTCNYSNLNDNFRNVYVTLTDYGVYSINAGGKVYVSIDATSGKMSVSFCELYYTASSVVELKGKITLN
ncbi:MAG: hypothetical protein WC223_03905 [Bacteroidales bacterium]|jgi:hypothetical protein